MSGKWQQMMNVLHTKSCQTEKHYCWLAICDQTPQDPYLAATAEVSAQVLCDLCSKVLCTIFGAETGRLACRASLLAGCS